MIRTLSTLLLVCAAAIGADRYVSPGGSNSGAGTIGDPWQTIAYAASQMAAGDTLHLRGGTYTETGWDDGATTGFPSGSTPEAPTKIQGYTGETAIWKPTTITSERYLMTVGINSATAPVARSNLWFEGFTVDLSASPLCAGGWHFRAFENITITNMVFQNLEDGYGFVVVAGNTTSPGGTNLALVGNTFTNWAYNQVRLDGKHGIYAKRMQSSRIAGNVFTNGHANATAKTSYAMHFYDAQSGYGATTMSTNLIVESNVVDTAHGGVVWSQLNAGAFRNNIVRTRGSVTGFSMGYYSTLAVRDSQIDNNTFYATGSGSPITVRSDVGSGNAIRNNILWATTATYAITSTGANANSVAVTNNIGRTGIHPFVLAAASGNLFGSSYDPEFADAPTDLELSETSLARDAGVNLYSLFQTDFVGAERPENGPFDIGAYEWITASTNVLSFRNGGAPVFNVLSDSDVGDSAILVVQRAQVFVGGELVDNTEGDCPFTFSTSGPDGAVEDVDYSVLSNSGQINDGEWYALITIQTKRNTAYTGQRIVRVQMEPGAAYELSGQTYYDVILLDADLPPSTFTRPQPQPGHGILPSPL